MAKMFFFMIWSGGFTFDGFYMKKTSFVDLKEFTCIFMTTCTSVFARYEIVTFYCVFYVPLSGTLDLLFFRLAFASYFVCIAGSRRLMLEEL